MNTKQAKQTAVDYLQARRSRGGYRYRDDATGSDWISPVRDLVELGRMLAAEEGVDMGDEFAEDAYSRWCSRTSAREVGAPRRARCA